MSYKNDIFKFQTNSLQIVRYTKLWFAKVIKLDVCGSLVFSNLVTFEKSGYHTHITNICKLSTMYFSVHVATKFLKFLKYIANSIAI